MRQDCSHKTRLQPLIGEPCLTHGVSFSGANDTLVPADYDGDGKSDVAVLRPSNGVWYLKRIQLGFIGIQFGTGVDFPVPADYDGDGRAGVLVFRNGVWYLNRTQAGFTEISLGTGADKPVLNAFIPFPNAFIP